MTRLFGLHRSTNLLVNGNHAAIRQPARHLEAVDYLWTLPGYGNILLACPRSKCGASSWIDPIIFWASPTRLLSKQERASCTRAGRKHGARSNTSSNSEIVSADEYKRVLPTRNPRLGGTIGDLEGKSARSVSPSLLSESPSCPSPPP